jgi:hypothetical protein
VVVLCKHESKLFLVVYQVYRFTVLAPTREVRAEEIHAGSTVSQQMEI